MGNGERLQRAFYARDTLTVARHLLGQRLVRILDGSTGLTAGGSTEFAAGGQRLSGRIVEVEAYIGQGDQACHAARGLTPRTKVMFGPPGRAYVYFIYGMYHCLNVVTEREGFPAAVLIRALEPLEGLPLMRRHRPGHLDQELTNGPGKFCQALGITREMNGIDMARSEVLFIEKETPVPDEAVQTTPRINVRGDERALTVRWRFVIRGSPFCSRRSVSGKEEEAEHP